MSSLNDRIGRLWGAILDIEDIEPEDVARCLEAVDLLNVESANVSHADEPKVQSSSIRLVKHWDYGSVAPVLSSDDLRPAEHCWSRTCTLGVHEDEFHFDWDGPFHQARGEADRPWRYCHSALPKFK